MTAIELTDFFDNYMYQTYFLRTKKIYEITNNLDLFLLKTLKKEFALHYLKKALQLAKELEGLVPSTQIEYDNNAHNASILMRQYLKEKKGSEIDLVNEKLDGIINEAEYDLVENIFEDMADFLYDIDELIRYKENISKTENLSQDKNKIEEEIELIDYSESNNTSKIVFLQKLGIIEYMRGLSPFNTSINCLANALSGVTGVKTVTIQPMLNAMLSDGTSDKNNPLKSSKTVNIVINKLTNIGYKAE